MNVCTPRYESIDHDIIITIIMIICRLLTSFSECHRMAHKFRKKTCSIYNINVIIFVYNKKKHRIYSYIIMRARKFAYKNIVVYIRVIVVRYKIPCCRPLFGTYLTNYIDFLVVTLVCINKTSLVKLTTVFRCSLLTQGGFFLHRFVGVQSIKQ